MRFADIKPFVRYARYISVSPNDSFHEKIPYDSRLFYTAHGEGVIKVDGIDYKTSRGDILVVSAGTPYRIETPSAELKFAIVNFDYTEPKQNKIQPIPPSLPSDYIESELIPVPDFEDGNDKVIYISGAYNMEAEIDGIVKEFSTRLLYFDAKNSAAMSVVLFDVRRRQLCGVPSRKDSRLDEILAYIDLYFFEELSNTRIAEVFSFHPNYVGEIIKRGTSMPLHKYLVHVRLIKALDMLDSGEGNVSYVAESCGFFDAAHFSRAFKKAFGDCPSRYVNKRG